MRPGTVSARPGQDAGLPDQRLCILHRYAYKRRTGQERKRTTALCPGYLAGNTFYTERERAALAWTEVVRQIVAGHVPDAVYEEVRQHVSEEELVNLTLAIVAMNGWNRFAISFRTVPGTYQPTHR